MKQSPTWFDVYLVNIKSWGRLIQIFVAFLECPNRKLCCIPKRWFFHIYSDIPMYILEKKKLQSLNFYIGKSNFAIFELKVHWKKKSLQSWNLASFRFHNPANITASNNTIWISTLEKHTATLCTHLIEKSMARQLWLLNSLYWDQMTSTVKLLVWCTF